MRHIDVAADLHCRSCEQRVLRAVRSLDGIGSARTDLRRQRVAVEFDDELVAESKVRAAVEGAGAHGILDR
jgi:copper chaperone CopZ